MKSINTSSENYFENVFENGLLESNNKSKYTWNLLDQAGNAFFVDINDLPNTFIKTDGKQGRPNAPAAKKKEMKAKGCFISTRAQPHPTTGKDGCMVYVKQISKVA